jgi:hypothetical protein
MGLPTPGGRTSQEPGEAAQARPFSPVARIPARVTDERSDGAGETGVFRDDRFVARPRRGRGRQMLGGARHHCSRI